MRFQSFLIKYAEIGVKGKNRYLFEDKLVAQIARALRSVDGTFEVWKTTGRIYVDAKTDYDFEEVIDALQHVFGIAGICPLLQIEDNGFEDLCRQTVAFLNERYEDKHLTFKVVARRARKSYPIHSEEINARLGEAILNAFPEMRVNVHHPDFFVNVEVREKINIYTEVIPGPGGMPLGTNGRAMLLLSGGIDSPVAGYMVAKRGVELDAVYFHAPPYTSERAKQKVVDLARIVSRYAGPIRLHVVNFTDIQMYIYEKCPHDELTIIMRRYMMRIAERLAQENHCLALVTGESIGQVASQTMQSLAVTNEVCSLPVIRPVIAFDKQEIVDVSERIGTYETSIQPYEDCCTIFVAKHPVTKPLLKVIVRSEQKLVEEIDAKVEEALATVETIEIE
ncbi:MAG: tRNA 4-thiouridine(8) synthase ThiI [Lachnospiraceae bacterium]|nr:tRNA 4-thiouridine(8) synthase ThiI [Lachnospiraceae bacterium]